jgi:hypothetical protein
VKKLLRIILIAILAGLTLILGLAGFTQTQFFRDRLRSMALSRLESVMTGEVRMGEIHGNLVTGFSIDSLAIFVDENPVFTVDRIDLLYDLFQLPGRTVSFHSLKLVRPAVTVIKPAGKTWNTSRLFRVQAPDTTVSPTAKSSSPWTIVVDRIELNDGSLRVVDSIAIHDSAYAVPLDRHTGDFLFRSVNMLMSATISPIEKHVTISRLSAVADSHAVVLTDCSGDFRLTKAEAEVNDLEIRTGTSFVKLSARMQQVDLERGVDLEFLEHCPTELHLSGTPINLVELQQFLPPLRFLRGSASIALDAEGEFGRLAIRKLDLKTGNTTLKWKGTISNLHRPEDLALNVKLYDGTLDPADPVALMPPFNLPDFSSVGICGLTIDFEGRPLDFRTRVVLSTKEAGTVTSDVSLAIGGPKSLKYKGQVEFEHVELSRIFSRSWLTSDLNGTASIEGEGVKLDELSTTARLNLKPSRFSDLPVPESHVEAEARNRQVQIDADLGLGNMQSVLKAHLDRANVRIPRYSITTQVSSLNLADILHDQTLRSDLSLKFSLEGKGVLLDSLGGRAKLDLSNSMFRDYRLEQGNIDLSLNQDDPLHKSLMLTSNVADLSLEGAFHLGTLGNIVRYQLQNLQLAVGNKLAAVDSSFVPKFDRREFAALRKLLSASKDSIHASYSIEIKDLTPVSRVAGNRHFQGLVNLNGFVGGSFEDLRLSGAVNCAYFVFGNIEHGLLLQNAGLAYSLSHLQPDNPLRSASAGIRLSAEKMHVNALAFDSIRARMMFADEYSTFSFSTIEDTVGRVSFTGGAAVTDSGVTARLTALRIGWKDFIWDADSLTRITIMPSDLSISDLTLTRDSSAVKLSGRIRNGDALSLDLSGEKLDLRDLKYVLKKKLRIGDVPEFSGSCAVNLRASGTMAEPVMHSTLSLDHVAFRGVAFGLLNATAEYSDTTLRVDLRGGEDLQDTAGARLSIAGAIPLNLALTDVDERLPDREMTLAIRSRGTPINVLDPLLPSFRELNGMMLCNVTVGGPPRHPTYHGNISLDSCSFLFDPNNIRYTLNGTFAPEQERIRVIDAVVRNVPSDLQAGQDGEVHITGDFAFHDFKPEDFSLTASGSLLVVKEDSRLTALELYGRLYAEIGSSGIRYTGNIDNSRLKGNVIIANSSLVFPPTSSGAREESQLSVPLIFKDDTTSVRTPGTPTEVAEYFAADSSSRATAIVETAPSIGFVDGIHYDLDIDATGGNAQIKMIFNSITKEELVANIEGRFNILGDGREWFGDLAVNRAYYSFFKRFDAEGSLRYRGNVMNPELNITASYTGQRSDTSGRGTETIVVTFKITGTRSEPKINWSMTVNGEDYYSYRGLKSNDVQTDAIQFIVYGTFPMTNMQKANAAVDIGTTVSSSIVSGAGSFLTGALSDFLRTNTGVINRVEVNYGSKGTFSESADIRLSGVAWNGYWQYGGKILDNPLGNANVSIMYSFKDILGKPELRNFMLALERKVEPNILSPTNDLKATNSARLFYRFSF